MGKIYMNKTSQYDPYSISNPDSFYDRFHRVRFRKRRVVTVKKKKYRRPKKLRKLKKFKKFVGKIQKYLGETKETTYYNQNMYPILVSDSTSTPYSLMNIAEFPATGTAGNEKIGNEIFLKSIVLQMVVLNTATNTDYNPIRIVIFKSWNKQNTIVPTEIFEDGTNSAQWLIARFKPGFGKKLFDFKIYPKLPEENEYNVNVNVYQNYTKTLKINKTLYLDPKDSTMFNRAFIYMYAFSSGAKVGLGSRIEIATRWYYKDS